MKDILFLGDFLYDYNKINDDILELSRFIKENDFVTILNFEGIFKDKNNKKKSLNYCTKESIKVLKLLNVVAVNLANEHVMKHGKKGLKNLIDTLDEAGIGHFGAGMNLEESLKPFVLTFGRRKITFYGMGAKDAGCVWATKKKAGVAPLDYKIVKGIVNKLDALHLVFCFHFGYEFESLPQPYDYKKCREIAWSKHVKAIIGHHPHVVQGYDKHYNIFYSLGNFYKGSLRKKYNKDFKYYYQTNHGIGVIMDSMYWKTKIIKLVTEDENTKIVNDVDFENLKDISGFPITKYPEYFKKNNNTFSRMCVNNIGWFYEKIWNKSNHFRRKIYKFIRGIK